MGMIKSLKLAGWKSIREANVEFGPINVLIGANGSGKSNLIAFFKFLNELIGGRLQEWVNRSGGPESLFHYGIKRTHRLEATLEFVDGRDERKYYDCGFGPTPSGGLFFTHEVIGNLDEKGAGVKFIDPPILDVSSRLSVGESALLDTTLAESDTDEFRRILRSCQVFHFHDTSAESKLRRAAYVEDNRKIQHDGRNVAALLYRYRVQEKPVYDRIVSTIRLIYPRFGDFVLEPRALNPKEILLNWRERNEDFLFGPHQLSDGTLRAIAMVTLLLQPEVSLPDVIILDEPELGLHPYAIGLLAGLLRKVSSTTQVIVSTQSADLLNHFDADEIIITERNDRESCYKRLKKVELEQWLSDYSMGEIWQMNVVGGGPHR